MDSWHAGREAIHTAHHSHAHSHVFTQLTLSGKRDCSQFIRPFLESIAFVQLCCIRQGWQGNKRKGGLQWNAVGQHWSVRRKRAVVKQCDLKLWKTLPASTCMRIWVWSNWTKSSYSATTQTMTTQTKFEPFFFKLANQMPSWKQSNSYRFYLDHSGICWNDSRDALKPLASAHLPVFSGLKFKPV